MALSVIITGSNAYRYTGVNTSLRLASPQMRQTDSLRLANDIFRGFKEPPVMDGLMNGQCDAMSVKGTSFHCALGNVNNNPDSFPASYDPEELAKQIKANALRSGDALLPHEAAQEESNEPALKKLMRKHSAKVTSALSL